MAFIVKYNKKEYSTAPEGLWPAVCCDFIDKGILETGFGPKHQIELRWLIEPKDPETGKYFMVRRKFNVSLHEKAHLRKILEKWRGRTFTQQELDGFDIEAVVGHPCQVLVEHNISDDGTVFANVSSVLKPQTNAVPLRVNGDYVRVKDRPDFKAPQTERQAEHVEDDKSDWVPF